MYVYTSYPQKVSKWLALEDFSASGFSHFKKTYIKLERFNDSRSHFGQVAGILNARMQDFLKVCFIYIFIYRLFLKDLTTKLSAISRARNLPLFILLFQLENELFFL